MLASRALYRLPGLRNESLLTISRSIATYSRRTLDHRIYLNTIKGKTFAPKRQISSQDQTVNQEQPVDQCNDDVANNVEESQLDQELRVIRDVAIADLEKRLGKPLWKAIQEDKLAERIENGEFNVVNEQHPESVSAEVAESSISQLRNAGAAIEDVAREARNIHGEHLPKSILSQEETRVYTRLYGEPIPEYLVPEHDVQEQRDSEYEETPANTLLGVDGERVDYRLEDEEDIERGMDRQSGRREQNTYQTSKNATKTFNPIELEDIAKSIGGDVYSQEEYDELDEDEESDLPDDRAHPLTSIGKFSTSPRTFFLPKDTFVQPVEKIMSDFSNKQLKEMCERTFGGPGLPDSPLSPRITKFRQQLPIPLDASQHNMGQMEANAFLTTVMPPTYAAIESVLVETRKRLGSSWLNRLLTRPGGPRILDAGSGGVGILAWRDILNAHWEQLHNSSKELPPLPPSKTVVLTGSDTLRHRAASMLENTTFVPRLPDYVHIRDMPTLEDNRPAQQRKQFDVVIASHSLFGLKEEWERKQHVQNLWQLLSDEGGVLILIEKGIPRGFETIAATREMLLERHIAVPDGQKTYYSAHIEEDAPPKTTGMIIAPCTNHDRCPLYRAGGISRGRKDICSFQQRYIRPPFLQRVLGATDRNHDDVDFSYLAVLKGDDLRQRSFTNWDHVNDPMSAPKTIDRTSTAESQDSIISQIQTGFEDSDSSPPPTHLLPRIMNRPLKRRGHVTIDLCTPTAEIRRWTIPKSFSRQAYRDARKSRWGDLWALGAKTSVVRNLKLGTPAKDLEGAGGQMKGDLGKPRSRKERLQLQAEKLQNEEDDKEEQELLRLIDEDNLLDEEDDGDDDDCLIDMDTLLPKKKKTTSAKTSAPTPTPSGGRSVSRNSLKPDDDDDDKVDIKQQQQQQQRTKRTPKPRFHSSNNNDVLENAGRERIGEVDTLAAWSAEFDAIMADDEARDRVMQRGQRPTSKNTQRMKRDLRRERRQQQR